MTTTTAAPPPRCPRMWDGPNGPKIGHGQGGHRCWRETGHTERTCRCACDAVDDRSTR